MSAAPPDPALSHVIGASDPPLDERTLGALLAEVCQRHAGREALVVSFQQVRWTYAELGRRVQDLCAGLLRLGLQTGDRVGIWSPNCAEWLLAQLATARLGLVLVNINPAYRRDELIYALDKVGCAALITAVQFKTSAYAQMLHDLIPELVGHDARRPLHCAALPALRHIVALPLLPGGHAGGVDAAQAQALTRGMVAFESLCQPASAAEVQAIAACEARLDRHQPINIQFTSGTTGRPKGATLTHRNILNNGYFVGEAMRLTPEDRLCVPVPLYHCFGMVLGNLAALTHGAALVYPAPGFEPLATLQAVQDERCTGLHGVPTMFIALLDHPRFADFATPQLRTGIMAGSPCPIEVMRQVIARMNLRDITIAYGMTETSPVSFQSQTDDPLERRVSTVGRIHPHCEVKITGPEGETLPRGATGELCTRGYSVMQGYWDDDPQTRQAIDEDGWMHTGDLAQIDAAGYGQIVGRIKDMVIRGGENLYPREIEEFLYRHPAIQDVQVVGVPDARMGEELCACIILKPGQALDAAGVRAFCQGQIAHHKIPRHVRFMSEFPLTVTGKIQKFRLREALQAELKDPA
ncbi:AMP-binding protein [Amphibiibacter pelophylacis]|uniref:AMP-binding protein n=1 Tax=Amphibiibacter pelophylacis TaxID=1799477 RepID=A0ACC6P2S9_9BURK